MALDWENVTSFFRTVWKATVTVAKNTWSKVCYSVLVVLDTCDKFAFNFAYTEPEIGFDRETGDYKIMKLDYRIGDTKYTFFRQALTRPPRVQKILSAKLAYKSKTVEMGETVPSPIDVKHIVQSLAGPFQDFHGQIVKPSQIFQYFVPLSERGLISNSEWIAGGVLQVVILRDHNDLGSSDAPKWETKTFEMDDVIDLYTHTKSNPST